MAATMMAVGAGLSAVSSIQQSRSQAEGLQMKADFDQRQANLNRDLAAFQAEDAIRRGDKEAIAKQKQTKQLIGSQRVALAASGVEVDSGSALELQMDSAAIGAQEVMTIKNNAWREAWGYKTQANNLQAQGDFAQIGGKHAAKNTILTGNINAAGSAAKAFGYS